VTCVDGGSFCLTGLHPYLFVSGSKREYWRGEVTVVAVTTNFAKMLRTNLHIFNPISGYFAL
jgi:hypothetical protein